MLGVDSEEPKLSSGVGGGRRVGREGVLVLAVVGSGSDSSSSPSSSPSGIAGSGGLFVLEYDDIVPSSSYTDDALASRTISTPFSSSISSDM